MSCWSPIMSVHRDDAGFDHAGYGRSDITGIAVGQQLANVDHCRASRVRDLSNPGQRKAGPDGQAVDVGTDCTTDEGRDLCLDGPRCDTNCQRDVYYRHQGWLNAEDGPDWPHGIDRDLYHCQQGRWRGPRPVIDRHYEASHKWPAGRVLVFLNCVVQPLLNATDGITHGHKSGARTTGDEIAETTPKRGIQLGVEAVLEGTGVGYRINAWYSRRKQCDGASLHISASARCLRCDWDVKAGNTGGDEI